MTPLIKLKTSSAPKGKGAGDVWGGAIQDPFGGSYPNRVKWLPDEKKKSNQKEWKARVRYGKRWVVGIVFSAFKRMFGGTPVLIEMEEHDPGGQSQSGRLQQADRHVSRSNVESDRRIRYKLWQNKLNCATGYAWVTFLALFKHGDLLHGDPCRTSHMYPVASGKHRARVE